MSDESIAIVGASCRFPGAGNLERFWQLLASAGDAVSEVDDRRWSTRFYYHPDRGEPGKSYTWAAGLITDVDLFEPAFFGISPREAVQMDPQQRLLLELVWHALEDAGIPAAKLSGSGTGVYIGASTTDYSDLRLGDPAGGDAYFLIGNTLSILANRVSYTFDLRGPSLTVDTACSSSLVAFHHACEAIRTGRIESAIVGGVNLLLAPYPFLGFCRASMLSRRGRCYAFDERADGYVRGEGGGVVILKPLAAALADDDPIRAVVLGSGVNSDGRTIGLSLPSEAAQTSLLRSVYSQAGIAADALAFFEMHGTGTPVGDPIEAAAVGRALGCRRAEPLPIGSVKTNIGHLEPASGMAGLIKASLALERGVLPPTLHCETPNPQIPFAALNLRLAGSAEPIAASGAPRCAGVNAFGFGGTNAHVVLGAPPRPETRPPLPGPLPPLLVSARSEGSLRELVRAWRDRLAETPAADLAPLLRAAARQRDHHPHRIVVLAGSTSSPIDPLDAFLDGDASPEVVTGTAVSEGKLAFVFSGNGAQFALMGQQAYGASPAFRSAIADVDRELVPQLGWSTAELIAAGVKGEDVARADMAQPLLFAIQVGVVEALRECGIVASAHVGHSVGEIAAAWAAGALSLADAAKVVVWRSHHQQRTRGKGRMAALSLAPDAARALLAELDSRAEIAAFNAAHALTISGPNHEIERIEAEARRRGLWCRPLDLDFPFHSREMEPIRAGLLDNLSGLLSIPPAARLVSTVTGAVVDGELLGAEHWWRNIRHPVRFAEAADRLVGEGYRIFVEIGPSAILQSYLRDALRTADVQGRVLSSLSRADVGGDPFPTIAARCYASGYDLSSASLFTGPMQPRGLPLYPWQRTRFWFAETSEAADLANPPLDHPLLGYRQASAPTPCWTNHLDANIVPWIADHAIEGAAVFPAAAIIEIALAAARCRWPEAPAIDAFDVELRRPLPFETGRMRALRTTLGVGDGEWQLASSPRLSGEPETVHAVGRVAAATEPRTILEWTKTTGDRRELDGAALYRLAFDTGLDYGERFRTVERVVVLGEDRALVHLDPGAIGEPLDPYLLHPALLDGALQGLLGLLSDRQREAAGAAFLPWRFKHIRLPAPFGRVPRLARLRLTRIGARSISADVALCDAAGNVVAELAECWLRRVDLNRRGNPDERALRLDLDPSPLGEPTATGALDRIGACLSRLAAPYAADRRRRDEAPLLDALAASIGLSALRRLAPSDGLFSVRSLVDAKLLSPESRGIAECLLQSLQRLGAVSEAGAEWRLEPAEDLPEPSQIWRLLLADAPDLGAELALAATAIDSLPKVLVDGPRPQPVWLAPAIDHLLQGSPGSLTAIRLLCAALDEIAEAWPKSRKLRILELGARGGATRCFLDRLAQRGVAIGYVATSADPDLVARLGLLAGTSTGLSAIQWSPGTPGENLDAAPFDLIIGLNACARLRLDATQLADLSGLLAPHGVFLAAEPEPNLFWDTIFGQIEGWWDGDGGSPLRTGAEWQAELAMAGFLDAGSAKFASAPWPGAVFWGAAPYGSQARRRDGAMPRTISLVAGDSIFAGALQAQLAAANRRVLRRSLAGFDGPAAEDSGWDGGEGEAILFAVEPMGAGDGVERASQHLAALPRVAAWASERQAQLWLVTCDAQQSHPINLEEASASAALWGLGRVLVNEMPGLQVRLVDLAGSTPPAERARQIIDELAADSGETEIIWTSQGRHVSRLRTGLPPRWAAANDLLGLSAGPGGGIDSLDWEIRRPRAVGPGEVEIEVRAAGLNFRDMMWAMDLLPEEALIDGFAGPALGLECAGVVRSLGAAVDGLAVGDRVMGFAPAALGCRVVTVADAVVPIPEATSFGAAATIPVAFVTTIYALGHLAKLKAGEYVLIHAAAGGVGLAAIQYAKHCGATVIATAGSEAKRAFLRLAGADHVLDSRSLAFADQIRELTRGGGVDVVLNSLSGEAMERSLELLKPFGRFLELGKRDFYMNRRFHLSPLRQNVSYFAIDIDQLPLRRPDLARALLAEVALALEKGEIRPLAHRSFSFAEIGDAFRLMQASGHIGKLVLVPGDNDGVRLRQPPEFAVRRDGTYLVTGGIDGFGFEAARWLARRGAGSLALLGRRGTDTPGASARVAELAAEGAVVKVYRGDVADREALADILDEIRAKGPPLRGIVHAAAAIDDGLVGEIDAVRAGAVLRPKLGGALALDALTRADPIELFLMFSSATTLLGAPGQGLYVAANMTLETLARQRRAAGRPGLTVAWGPIADAGYLALRPEMRDNLARRLGARPLPAAQALAGLSALLASGLPTAGFAEANWSEARRLLPILAAPLFSEVRAKAGSAAFDDSLVDRLASLDPEAAQALLTTVVTEEAAGILRLPAGDIDPARPLSQLGMDSLMAVELRLALESRLRIDLPLMSLAEGTSIASVAARLASAYSAGAKDTEVSALAARHEGLASPGGDILEAAPRALAARQVNTAGAD